MEPRGRGGGAAGKLRPSPDADNSMGTHGYGTFAARAKEPGHHHGGGNEGPGKTYRETDDWWRATVRKGSY